MEENNIRVSKIQTVLFLFLLFLPAVFNPWGNSVFVIPKLFFLKIITITLFFIIITNFGISNTFIIPRTPLLLPVLLLLTSNAISTIFSYHFRTSYHEFENQIFFILFYFISLLILHKKKVINYSIIVSITVTTLISVYAILQTLKIDFVLWSDPTVSVRPSSTLGNPNFLAAYLSIIIPFLFYQLFTSGMFISKFFLSISTILIFTVLAHTYTRGGWISAVISLTVFFILCNKYNKKDLRKNLHYLVLIFVSTLVIFYFLNHKKIEIEKREFNLFKRATSISPSSYVRLNLWNDSLYLIRDGFPLGFGLDVYPLVYPKRRSVEISRLQAETALPEHAHNELLQTFVCEGIIGGFSYLFFLIVLFTSSFKNILKGTNNCLSITIFSSLLAYLVQSLVNPKVTDIKFLFYFLASLSFCTGKLSYIFIKFSEYPVRAKVISFAFVISGMLIIIPYLFNPLLADYIFRKGRDYIYSQKYDAAITSFYKAIEINPSSLLYFHHIGVFIRKIGEISKNKEIFNSAIEFHKMAKKINPKDASVYSDLGRAYASYALVFDDKEKFDLAISSYKTAISLDPKFPIFHNDLGIVYMNKGEHELAKKCFEKTIEIVPNFWEPYLNMGILYFKEKKFSQAIYFTKKAISKNPQDIVAWENLIFFLKESKNIKEALLWCKKARKQFPFDKNFKEICRVLKNEK